MNYYAKYIKYKLKYLNLKGGTKKAGGGGGGSSSTSLHKFIEIENHYEKIIVLFNHFVTQPLLRYSEEIAEAPSDSIKSAPRQHKKRSAMESTPEMPLETSPKFEPSTEFEPSKKRLSSEEKTVIEGQEWYGKVTPIKKPKPIPREAHYTDILVDAVSDEKKQEYRESLVGDTDVVSKLYDLAEDEDPEYRQYEANAHGKTIECWIGDTWACPCCRHYTLRRYQSNSMVAIDLVCINPTHTDAHGVRFFQVKASIDGVDFMGEPYFSLEHQMIHVGSRTYGEPIHSIRPLAGLDEKKLLIGYICIVIGRNMDKFIRILPAKSFIVLPKLIINVRAIIPGTDSFYYRYLTEPAISKKERIHHKITFSTDPQFNNIVKLDMMGFSKSQLKLSPDYDIIRARHYHSIPNPLADTIISA